MAEQVHMIPSPLSEAELIEFLEAMRQANALLGQQRDEARERCDELDETRRHLEAALVEARAERDAVVAQLDTTRARRVSTTPPKAGGCDLAEPRFSGSSRVDPENVAGRHL